MKILFLLSLILTTNYAHASIGETVAESVTRYGKSSPPIGYLDPETKGGVSYGFTCIHFKIGICFIHGIASYEFITKEDNSQFSLSDMVNLLRLEGRKWRADKGINDSSPSWIRDDGVKAFYNNEVPSVLIGVRS